MGWGGKREREAKVGEVCEKRGIRGKGGGGGAETDEEEHVTYLD